MQFAKEMPEAGIHKCWTTTYEQIENCRGHFPDDVVELMHDQLRHQTKVYEETVRPFETAKNQAHDRWIDATETVFRTPAATIGGLATVLAFVSTDQELVEFLEYYLDDFLKMLSATTARLAA
jgi:hypothetical protein